MKTDRRNSPDKRRTGLMSLGISLIFLSMIAPARGQGLGAVFGIAELDSLPVQFAVLERELLLDAANRRLDRFDFIEAGLIASGATDPYTLSQNRHRFKHIQQHALLSIPYLMQTDQMAAELFRYLHRHILLYFEHRPVTVLDLWQGGRYNCITASWLYLALASRYDLPVTVIETPLHAYVRLDTRPPIPIEMTAPQNGFNFAQTPEQVLKTLLDAGLISRRRVDKYGKDALFHAYQEQQRPLQPVQILSVLFYNRALAAFEAKEFQNAFRNALAAHLIHPEDVRYRRLTRDLGLAYATALRQNGDRAGEDGIMAYPQGLRIDRRF